MFGKIISIDGYVVLLENIKKEADANLIGFHLVFDEGTHKQIGEIVAVNKETIRVNLIGEIDNNVFSCGVLKNPSSNTIPRIIYKSELELILGSQNYLAKENLLFGLSPIYNNFVITSKQSDFFSNHFAILGNTGSGKSCGVTRILQNVFFASNNGLPNNAHICLFDVFGEYKNAFKEMNNLENLQFKTLTTNLHFSEGEILKIPAYLLDVDDLAILLNSTSSKDIPVLNNTLELTRIFTSRNEKAEIQKNYIISSCILNILSSGKTASQMRDQIMSLLTSYNTNTLNLNTIISQPGYNRTVKQCLNIDEQGKINSVHLIVDYLQQFAKTDLSTIIENEPIPYTLKDIYYALEFALINEGAYTLENAKELMILKTRLQTIINSELGKYFEVPNYLNVGDYIASFFSNNNRNAQLVDLDLSYLDDKFAKAITKILSKMFFNFTTKLQVRGSYPIHIILEEAHRYVQNDNDINVIGYNIFDRITKEGRKYGTIVGFLTQRPSELSKTSLSQCSNFIVFRLFYPDDLAIVKGMSSNLTNEILEKIKTLHPGMALTFGTAFATPLLVKFTLPNPLPVSTNINIDNIWYN